MKLYEVRTKNSESDWHGQTRFVTSMKDVTSLLKKAYEGMCYTISVPDRLSQEQWIGILEADSPGRQEITITPVDLIAREEKPTKTKGHERPRSKNNSD